MTDVLFVRAAPTSCRLRSLGAAAAAECFAQASRLRLRHGSTHHPLLFPFPYLLSSPHVARHSPLHLPLSLPISQDHFGPLPPCSPAPEPVRHTNVTPPSVPLIQAMPCTEVALLRLISPSCRDELEKSPVHSAALKTVSSQPGFLSCTWGVLAEDNTLLVWLVEWEALEDHTEQFMQSRDYPAFNRSLSSILHADKPVFSMSHFTFAQSPSRLASLSRGTLEVFQVLLRSVDDHAAFAQAWRPNLDKWTTQDRPNVMAAALDEDQKDKAMLLVAWESVKEHMDAKKTETYAGAIKEARTLFKETSPIALFGHIQPAVVMPSS